MFSFYFLDGKSTNNKVACWSWYKPSRKKAIQREKQKQQVQQQNDNNKKKNKTLP